MGYGTLILASSSDYNLYLTDKPQITFFKSHYKRYSNFAKETVPVYFNSKPDFGKTVSAIIPCDANLLSKVTLYIELPSLNTSKHNIIPDSYKKSRWIEKIGLGIFSYVDIEIGGIILERHYSDWLNIWYELTTPIEAKDAYNKSIGNITYLNDYSNGKNKYTLHIPLNFWFCTDSGLALPLTSLKHHEVKIHVKFNNFTNCIKQSPTHYFQTDNYVCLFKENEIITQEVDGITSKGEFIYFDITNQRVYYNKILGTFQIPTTDNNLYKITGNDSSFELNPKSNTLIVADENYFYYGNPVIENSYLLVDYIFLDKNEINFFNTTELKYLIPHVRFTLEKEISNIEYDYDFDLSNPTKAIFWKAILKSNVEINDKFNYTTYPLTTGYDNIIEKTKIIANSNNITDIDNWEFYYNIQKYLYDMNSTQKGIYSYFFSLNPKENIPSGSLNFSYIKNKELKLTLNNNINYQNPVYFIIYSITYNLLTIEEGLGGLKFIT
jgi:hypothetical protein